MKTLYRYDEIKVSPVPLNSGFKMDGYWVWCGSVVEEPGVGFHMYAARWPKTHPMFSGYIFLSEIVHAFSPNMTGPYEYVESVLPTGNPADWNGRMVHNPTVVKWRDKYLLYYIGTTYGNEVPPPDNIDRELMDSVYQKIRIGVAIADNPGGPWRDCKKPVLDSRPGKWDHKIVTNPAPCVLPDGRIYLYYRSNTSDGLRIGLACADNPEGPYVRVQDAPVMEGINVEDPFVWHNGDHFEMVAKDMTGDITGEFHAGAHFISEDGIHWNTTPNPKAYSRTVEFTDGSTDLMGCVERPQLLFDATGKPVCMFAATADGPGGFRKADNTWNMAFPIENNT